MSRSANQIYVQLRAGDWSLGRYPIIVEPGVLKLASIEIPVDTANPDTLLPTFVDLVATVRKRPLATAAEIRTADLDALVDALALRPAEVFARLKRIIEGPDTSR